MSSNERFPGCLLQLTEINAQLRQVRPAPAALQQLQISWSYLVASSIKFQDLMDGKQPPDSQPGDYEFGPLLPVLYYELPSVPGGQELLELLEGFGLPPSPISQAQWASDLKLLDAGGEVASDGSLVAHVDLAVADYCWVIAVVQYAKLVLGIDSRHPFQKAAGPISLPSSQQSLTLAIAGDWGSGWWNDSGKTPPSSAVLSQMAGLNPDVMVHLGDVYYAGTESGSILPGEEVEYFVDLWKPGSLGAVAAVTLNSNHEMYSGARGYFGDALGNPLFAAQKGASYFAIEFQDWLILGLDTAYYDPSTLFMNGALVDSDQLSFIAGLDPQDKKVLLLTHHNGLSYDGKSRTLLWSQVSAALGKDPEVWYWGHVHNGIVYSAKAPAGKTLARCCGHGSLPFGNAYGLQQPGSGQPIDEVLYYAHTPLPAPVLPAQKNRVLNGFAFVTLEKGKIAESFYEQGNPNPVWSNTAQL